MAECNGIVISPTGLKVAADEILAQLKTIIDDNKNIIFKSVDRGLFWPGLDAPKKDTVPMVRLWYDTNVHRSTNVQFFAQDRTVTLALYIYNYSFTKTPSGEIVDIQDFCDALSMLVLNYLKKPEVGGIGLEIANKATWWFESPQEMHVKSGNVLRRFNSNYAMPPEWFTIEILFDVHVENIAH